MVTEFSLKNSKYQRILKQLQMSGISKGIWVDAGSGRGTYTFALATLATRVIAIDKNPNNVYYLKTQLPSTTNIEVYEKDFNQEAFFPDLVDGVLFGFSLHYEPPVEALQNAFNQLKDKGMILIIEYGREEPLPWVPLPVPKLHLIKLLKKIGFNQIETILEDSRFYIVRGRKPRQN